MRELEMVAKIRLEWGAFIRDAVKDTCIPEALVGALVANESGGRDDARRFEPKVYADLVRVQVGTAPRYGSITKADLAGLGDEALRGLASSWGATQIMGYNAVCHKVDYLALGNPAVSMPLTVLMLSEFARKWGLDPAANPEALLRCWNTGGPNGKTFDEGYVSKGLARMRIYAEG